MIVVRSALSVMFGCLGKASKKGDFITLNTDPPQEVIKKYFLFLDTKPFFEHFLKKMFPLENLLRMK